MPDRSAALSSEAAGDTAPLDLLARRVLGLLPIDGRIVVGIAGSPGAGKTTLAERLARRLTELAGVDAAAAAGPATGATAAVPFAVHLPMDGFHLANATLDRLGRHDRKGAIDTFDGWGFVALLRRLRAETDHPVYAPSFDRAVDEGVAGALVVEPGTRIVIVEGNYLLVDREPWNLVPGLAAEVWFCETPGAERLQRLVARHQRHGRSPGAARDWAENVDGANAVLIERSAPRATLRVSGLDASVIPSA
ncbi:nucleoside/nucleotide kinase family protein [Cryobacterium sp. TMB1-7]|uniref:nucleoside/nucleotide kinase family protein n=1 Tax=Cryobacterium sp. TMB1-7 TaxID=2555866 RepID=UPI001F542116|nr:nucleoside/nucleotide kinase family protein [Cryobacterium sp. TMB1-7]